MSRLAPRALRSTAALAALDRAAKKQASDLTFAQPQVCGRELLRHRRAGEHGHRYIVESVGNALPSCSSTAARVVRKFVLTNEHDRAPLRRTASCVVGALVGLRMRVFRWMVLALSAAPAVLAAQSHAPVVPSPHLMVGDRVVVKVWPEVKLSDTVLVDDRGEISLPHVGSIGVLALDYDGLRDTLRARYATFLRSPVIDVVAFRRVTVNGAVGKPDVYMIDVTSTIRDVIARAGGVAPYGDAHRVSILREGRSIAAPNWDQPAKSAEYPLQSGDVIFVGRRPWWVENLGTVTGVAGLAVSLAFTLLRK
jgi:protein involved in polysaccharide export with SLBB domain